MKQEPLLFGEVASPSLAWQAWAYGAGEGSMAQRDVCSNPATKLGHANRCAKSKRMPFLRALEEAERQGQLCPALARYDGLYKLMQEKAAMRGGSFSMSNFFCGFRCAFRTGQHQQLQDADPVDKTCKKCVVTWGEFKLALSGDPVWQGFLRRQAAEALAVAVRAAGAVASAADMAQGKS